MLRAVQMHPYKRQVMHLDFLRVSADRKLRMTVPLHFLGEDVAPGVKQGGGVVSHLMPEVEIECLAKDLPEFIAVDISKLELNESVHLSGLALPARRITINLAPADLPKEGSHYDLPIALGLMAAIGAVPHDALSGFTVLGELALDGSIAPVAARPRPRPAMTFSLKRVAGRRGGP